MDMIDHNRTRELIKRLLAAVRPGDALSATEFHELAAATLEGLEDTERLDWMDRHPLPTEIHGGADDGHAGKAWGVAAHEGTLRDALDKLRAIKPI